MQKTRTDALRSALPIDLESFLPLIKCLRKSLTFPAGSILQKWRCSVVWRKELWTRSQALRPWLDRVHSLLNKYVIRSDQTACCNPWGHKEMDMISDKIRRALTGLIASSPVHSAPVNKLKPSLLQGLNAVTAYSSAWVSVPCQPVKSFKQANCILSWWPRQPTLLMLQILLSTTIAHSLCWQVQNLCGPAWQAMSSSPGM